MVRQAAAVDRHGHRVAYETGQEGETDGEADRLATENEEPTPPIGLEQVGREGDKGRPQDVGDQGVGVDGRRLVGIGQDALVVQP